MSHRPELHITAEEGILDAPAGVLVHDDTWHVFNQYRPLASAGARWAHQTSTSQPYDWDVCDDVLAPYRDEQQVQAGSVIPVGDGIDMFFTAVTDDGTSIKVAEIPDADATIETVSDDILRLDSHVGHVTEVLRDQDGYSRFRSSCVVEDWRHPSPEGIAGWLMLAVAGSSESPHIVVLDSADRRQWSVVGELSFVGRSGLEEYSRVVSPRILHLKDETDGRIYDVALVTVESATEAIPGYLVGVLHDATFDVLTPFTRLDYGYDFARPRNANSTAPDDTRYESATIFGLMNGAGQGDDPRHHLSLREENWANCLSFPRTVTLQGGYLYQTPQPGLLEAIRASESVYALTTHLEGLGTVGSAVRLELRDAHATLRATVSVTVDSVTVDRSMNPLHGDSAGTKAPRHGEDTESLTVIVDGSTVEIFADGGAIVMASRVYFDGGCTDVRYVTTGGAGVVSTLEIAPA